MHVVWSFKQEQGAQVFETDRRLYIFGGLLMFYIDL